MYVSAQSSRSIGFGKIKTILMVPCGQMNSKFFDQRGQHHVVYCESSELCIQISDALRNSLFKNTAEDRQFRFTESTI